MKDDTISRQAAIKAIENLQDCYNGFSNTYDKACIIGALEEVPSAQPEPIKMSVDREMTEEELKELKKKIADTPVVLVPLPSAQPEWNNHTVACLLADMFGDSCACNFNGIDEWLPEKCDFADTACPSPAGVACWEQFLKYREKNK